MFSSSVNLCERVYGDCYPAKGFLTTKSKFDGADDELSMLNHVYIKKDRVVPCLFY